MKIIVTGGAGFIGSALVRFLIQKTDHQIWVFDKLTYAGNLESLHEVSSHSRFNFMKGDIAAMDQVQELISAVNPDAIMHLAAESHVDRSIDGPAEFIQTNIIGTFNLLEASLKYWKENGSSSHFRFQHISTDEVYGSLGPEGKFTEETKYDPSSPYSASKAASDHLVRAWHRTYGLPILLTNCSNNYGPFHYPEKLIPLIILNALKGKDLPVYGDGKQIRDWLYVEDHVEALYAVLSEGKIGETYNIGGDSERQNIEVVNLICSILDEARPSKTSYSNQIKFVQDRPGHDRRYAIDASKMRNSLGWKPKHKFEDGIRETVLWFLKNEAWVKAVLANKYDTERLGLR